MNHDNHCAEHMVFNCAHPIHELRELRKKNRDHDAALSAKDRIIERHVRWRAEALRLLGTCRLTPEIRDFIDSATTRISEAGFPPSDAGKAALTPKEPTHD